EELRGVEIVQCRQRVQGALHRHVHEREARAALEAAPVVLAGEGLGVVAKLPAEFLEAVGVSSRQGLRKTAETRVVCQLGIDRYDGTAELDDVVDSLASIGVGPSLPLEVPAFLQAEGDELVAKRELAEGPAAFRIGDLAGPVQQCALDPAVASGGLERACSELVLLLPEVLDRLLQELELARLAGYRLTVLLMLAAELDQMALPILRHSLLGCELLVSATQLDLESDQLAVKRVGSLETIFGVFQAR